ncbi:MAG: signal recognition particle-docking protein FtsY [Anaerolineae bacterium]
MLGRGANIHQGLARTRQSIFGRITGLLGANELTDQLWDELEELLILADVGVATTTDLIENLRHEARRQGVRRADEVQGMLREGLVQILKEIPPDGSGEYLLTVILVVGVNGSGKTTSIAKLARYHQNRGRRVLLAAADTFRAAAIDQLKIWGERVGTEVISHQPGGDPGAVVYDAIQAGRARKADVLIVDTAGRLHTKYNLMEELKKIYRVANKQVHQAPHQTLLVLDATTGQNALAQAKYFKEAVRVTGIILAKLDGTAKGGIAFAIVRELGIPIQFVGTGEGLDDLAPFEAEVFVQGLFA